MKNINYEETETLVSSKLKKLEADIKYELPEEYYESKKENVFGKVLYYVISAAALFGVTFGIWSAAQHAQNYTADTPEVSAMKQALLETVEAAERLQVAEELKEEDINMICEACADPMRRAESYGTDIFSPLIMFDKQRIVERGYFSAQEIESYTKIDPSGAVKGDFPLGRICMDLFKESGDFDRILEDVFTLNEEAGYLTAYNQSFKFGITMPEKVFDGVGVLDIEIIFAPVRQQYEGGPDAFDAAYPTVASFLEAYRQVWYSSEACLRLIDALDEIGQRVDHFSDNYAWRIGLTRYMTEAEINELTEKVIAAGAGQTKFISFSSEMFKLLTHKPEGLRYNETLKLVNLSFDMKLSETGRKNVVSSANKLDFEELKKVTADDDAMTAFIKAAAPDEFE